MTEREATHGQLHRGLSSSYRIGGSVCGVDATGKIVREAKVASEPEGLVRFFRELGVAVSRIGLEAGSLSQWLHAGLAEAGSH